MAYARFNRAVVTWTPVAVGTGAVKKVFRFRKGDRLLSCSVKRTKIPGPSNDGTITIGDTGDADGVMTVTAGVLYQASGNGTLIDSEGAYFANTGGHLYTADTDVNVTYAVGTPGTVTPIVSITFTYTKEAGVAY